MQVPRTAVILAAGIGSRLHPYTIDRPKPLVEVNGVPILTNALANLEAHGVRETIIVVGYRQDDIRTAVGNAFGKMAMTYVQSPLFATTGTAWSLWMASEKLFGGDTYLLEGDVFFEQALLARLDDGSNGNVTAVATFTKDMQGSAVVIDRQNRVTDFLIGQGGGESHHEGPLFKTINIYRLSQHFLETALVPALARLADEDRIDLKIEHVLNSLVSADHRMEAVLCDDVKWFEIDTDADLDAATRLFGGSLAAQTSEHGSC